MQPPKIDALVPVPALSYVDKFRLTETDIEILKGQSNGLSYKEIAPLVYLSYRTIEARGQKILIKMNCGHIAHAVAKAIRLKIIE